MIKKIVLIIFLTITSLFSEIDSTKIISYEHFNLIEQINQTNYVTYPADEWGFAGSLSSNGLPGFANDFQYNGFNVSDPLYGGINFSWINPKYSNLEINSKKNLINQRSIYNYQKDLYSRFDWLYRGSYDLGSFGAIISGKINDEYYFTLHGENFTFPGYWDVNDINRSTSVEHNLSQDIGLNIKKVTETGTIESGFNYKKMFPGIAAFQESSNEQGIYQEAYYDGYSKKDKKQLYLKYSEQDSLGDFQIGGQVSQFNYTYQPSDTLMDFTGQGNTYSIIAEKSRFFASDSISISLNYNMNSVYLKNYTDVENQVYSLQLNDRGQKSGIEYDLSLGIKNENLIYSATLNRKLYENIYIGINSNMNHFQYPILYNLYAGAVKAPFDTDDFFMTNSNSIFLNYKNSFIDFKTSLDYTGSEFYRPYKTSNDDSLFSFQKANLNDFFINSQLTLSFPWKTSLYGKVQYSPTVDIHEFYHFHFNGSIEQELTLFKGNLNLYARGSVYYYAGGEDLIWNQEFQTVGITDEVYYTNEPLYFSAKIGVKVGSLHGFYQFNNLENRQFSVIQSMPLQYRIQVLGIEWYFLN